MHLTSAEHGVIGSYAIIGRASAHRLWRGLARGNISATTM